MRPGRVLPSRSSARRLAPERSGRPGHAPSTSRASPRPVLCARPHQGALSIGRGHMHREGRDRNRRRPEAPVPVIRRRLWPAGARSTIAAPTGAQGPGRVGVWRATRLKRHPGPRSTAAEVAGALSRSPEAVAYIGGGSKRSVSRRLICRGALPEGLRTAHFAWRSEAGRRRRTYATASPEAKRPRPVGPSSTTSTAWPRNWSSRSARRSRCRAQAAHDQAVQPVRPGPSAGGVRP